MNGASLVEWWTPEEAATYLKMSVKTVKKLCSEAAILSRRLGRNWRMPRHAVLDFAKSKLCKEVRLRERAGKLRSRDLHGRKASSFVYFLQCQTTGRIKIGYSTKPEARFLDLKVGPTVLTLLALAPGHIDVEHGLHKRFKPWRHHGEWFDPAPELLDYIAQIASVAVGEETRHG